MKNPFEEKIEGLESYRWISVEDCSKELGVSVERVRQIEAAALKKMKTSLQ